MANKKVNKATSKVGTEKDGFASGGSSGSTAAAPATPQPGHVLLENLNGAAWQNDDGERSWLGLDISYVGFCGIDDTIDVKKVCDLSHEYKFVEWGILFHPEKQGKCTRYPSVEWLKRLGEEVERMGKVFPRLSSGREVHHAGHPVRMGDEASSFEIRLVAHLCGDHCLQALQGENRFIRTLHEDYGFARIQLNPTKNNGVNEPNIRKYWESLRTLIHQHPNIEFVFQVNKQTSSLAFLLMDNPPSNLAFLYAADRSPNGGVSKVPARRPVPVAHPGVHIGYAGGLSPENLKAELKKISNACSGNTNLIPGTRCNSNGRFIWIDMESSLRNDNDEFDINQCHKVINALFELGFEYCRDENRTMKLVWNPGCLFGVPHRGTIEEQEQVAAFQCKINARPIGVES